jgi:hypothetical protein
MNKFIIEESEKERILTMHKSLLKEQTEPTLKNQLQKFIDDGCFPSGNPKIVAMKSSNPNKVFAIKIESTKTPGKFRYFFIDNTVGEMNNGSFRYLDIPWECDQNAVKNKTSITSNIENIKKEGGWKTYDELIATDTRENISNPAMYEKKVIDGIELYRRTSGKGITSGLDERQQKVVDKWKSQGAKLENEVDAEQAKTWSRKLVSPKSEGLFSEDFYMYFPPTTITDTEITTRFEDAVREQTPESADDCKKTIEAYYMAYTKSKQIEPNMLNAMKEKVQACKNEFYGSWGAFRGGKQIDTYLDYLSGTQTNIPGVKKPGPSSYGATAVWRLGK